MYISHVELENSLSKGTSTDVEFFSKILRTMGYYLHPWRSVNDSSKDMKDDIGKFINILYLTEDKKNIIAKILIFIGIYYNKYYGFKRIQPGGRVLNSYKSKELKIYIIK